MNEIGYALGSFCGGLFIGAISWKFGAWLSEAMFKNALLGAVLSFWYATARDDTPSAWGAWIAFALNHLINSHDQGEAFFIRWIILHFPNSRLVSGLPLDTTLASRIIEQELPGIAHWAFEGAARLLLNNGFSKSAAHDRQMQKWRRSNSSVEEFIHECCELGSGFTAKKSEFYDKYREWCPGAGRKAFGKSKVKELLANNVALGVSLAVLNGYDVLRGVRLKLDSEMDPYPFALRTSNSEEPQVP